MTDIAFSLLAPIILGFLAGYYLDSKYSAKFPIWTLVFTIIGIITGMWSVYKRSIK